MLGFLCPSREGLEWRHGGSIIWVSQQLRLLPQRCLDQSLPDWLVVSCSSPQRWRHPLRVPHITGPATESSSHYSVMGSGVAHPPSREDTPHRLPFRPTVLEHPTSGGLRWAGWPPSLSSSAPLIPKVSSERWVHSHTGPVAWPGWWGTGESGKKSVTQHRAMLR